MEKLSVSAVGLLRIGAESRAERGPTEREHSSTGEYGTELRGSLQSPTYPSALRCPTCIAPDGLLQAVAGADQNLLATHFS